jgi:YfiR/HmsC-like
MNARATSRVQRPPPSKLVHGRAAQWVATVACLVLCMVVCRGSSADSGVPLALQALLLSRLGTYDRNFRERAGPVANVLVMHRTNNSESSFEATGLAKALAELRDIGGLPFKIDEAEFSDPESLAKRCRTDRIAVVYLTVGLEGDTPRIASALVNVDVMTVGTSARHAENGAVVAFAVEEARPKLVINLKQAAAQSVNFKAEVLALARLIE